jgi:hypothetical protein
MLKTLLKIAIRYCVLKKDFILMKSLKNKLIKLKQLLGTALKKKIFMNIDVF